MDLILGIVLLVAAIFLVVAVLMQNGKSRRLSGTIAGGAETFFGKEKGKAIDKKLTKKLAEYTKRYGRFNYPPKKENELTSSEIE